MLLWLRSAEGYVVGERLGILQYIDRRRIVVDEVINEVIISEAVGVTLPNLLM